MIEIKRVLMRYVDSASLVWFITPVRKMWTFTT